MHFLELYRSVLPGLQAGFDQRLLYVLLHCELILFIKNMLQK